MRSLRSARSALGPCRNGPTRPSAVTNSPEEPQVAGRPAQAVGMMRACDSDCGPRRSGSVRRAADGQQPATVGINMILGEPSRIVG
jgi:hypothetical protein